MIQRVPTSLCGCWKAKILDITLGEFARFAVGRPLHNRWKGVTKIRDPVQILEKLVGFQTVSSESNLSLVAFVEEFLGRFGVESFRDYNSDRTKANVYAQIGPDVPGGVILSAHTDVVPVKGQKWSGDPFRLSEREGRIYGRGTADMKGFLAVVLANVSDWVDAGLKRPVQLAFSYDEEVGCLGAPSMIGKLSKRFPRAKSVIVGEPTMMKMVNGHKSSANFNVHVRGHEVHSCQVDRGVSAVMNAARLIGWLEDRTSENRAGAARESAGFDPPYTTLHAGMVSGGTACNITARDCWFSTDIRCIPSESTADWISRFEHYAAGIQERMQGVNSETGIRLSDLNVVPGLKPEHRGTAEALVRKLTGDNDSNVVSYGTEAGQFQEEGYSAVICGPGSIDQAHQPDEFVSRRQLEECNQFMRRLTTDLAA